jgi:hypothetical protein
LFLPTQAIRIARTVSLQARRETGPPSHRTDDKKVIYTS